MKRSLGILALGIMIGVLAGQSSPQVEPNAEADAQPARKVATKAPGPIVREAQRAMEAEEYAKAEALLSEAMKLLPGEASLPYNLGVARYRQGDFTGAGEAFSRAAELANDPNLRARSAFNQGTSTYAQALKHLQDGQANESLEQPLKDSIDLVGNSLEQLKGAIDADPTDRDARANAELAHRLLKQLEEIQQQMQQQQQQDQQQSSDEQESQDEQQQSSQQNQEQSEQQQQQQDQQSQGGEQQDEQQQDQEQPQSGEQQSEEQQSEEQQQAQQGEQQEQEQDSQSQSKQEQEQEQQSESEQQAQPQQGEQNEQQGEADQQESESEADDGQEREGTPREGQMTREQAERLLQMVRDKQRERRAAQAAKRAASREPAVRDW